MENKLIYSLHKQPEQFLITSNEDYNEGDNVLDNVGRVWINMESCFVKASKQNSYGKSYKIIAQQDQIDFSGLSEEEQKRIDWFDVEKLAEKYLLSNVERNQYGDELSFIDGFNKAQELLSDRAFTLKDMHIAALEGGSIGGIFGKSKPKEIIKKISEYIQSLSQPKSWKIEIEMEEYGVCNICNKQGLRHCDRPEECDSSETLFRPKLTNGKIKILRLL